jgi:hypothetical protein
MTEHVIDNCDRSITLFAFLSVKKADISKTAKISQFSKRVQSASSPETSLSPVFLAKKSEAHTRHEAGDESPN